MSVTEGIKLKVNKILIDLTFYILHIPFYMLVPPLSRDLFSFSLDWGPVLE